MKTALLLSSALAAGSLGCSTQIGSGLEKAADGWKPVLVLSSAAHPTQRRGPLVGLTMVSRLAEAKGVPFRIRRGSIDMGYHFVIDDGTSDKDLLASIDAPVLELGLGTPLDRTLAETSFYTGLRAGAQIKLWGQREWDRLHRTISVWGDLSFTGRGGVWSLAEASGGKFVGTGEVDVALRFTFVSDLASAHVPRVR